MSGLKTPKIQFPQLNGIGKYRLSETNVGDPVSTRKPQPGDESFKVGVPGMPNMAKASQDASYAKNIDAAEKIVSHVDELLGALHQMHSVNQFWKVKYIQCRADHLKKHIPNNQIKALDTSFNAWKNYVFTAGNVGRLERLKQHMEDLVEGGKETMEAREESHYGELRSIQSEHDSQLEILAKKIEDQNKECQEILSELEFYSTRDTLSRDLLKSLRRTVDANPERCFLMDDKKTFGKELAGNLEYTTRQLHEVLMEVDPKYVPPIGAETVVQPSQPATLLPSVIMTLPRIEGLNWRSALETPVGNGTA